MLFIATKIFANFISIDKFVNEITEVISSNLFEGLNLCSKHCD